MCNISFSRTITITACVYIKIYSLLPAVDRKARTITQYIKKAISIRNVQTGCSSRHGIAEIHDPASWNNATTNAIRFLITKITSNNIT